MRSAGSLTSSRTRSAAATPPGSRRSTASGSRCASPAASVVLPAPSRPSMVTSGIGAGAYDAGQMLPGLERHPHARAVLRLDAPSHAYLFHGPAGAGKRDVARAFAAELLAEGAADPDNARARALRGTHPDLTWVAPSGAADMLVSDIDEPVVAAAARTPFESARRVFVIERADTMNDEAANRMLKTLEEPPAFAHLVLLTDRPGNVLPTIASRCQHVRFDALPAGEPAARVRGRGRAPPRGGGGGPRPPRRRARARGCRWATARRRWRSPSGPARPAARRPSVTRARACATTWATG